MNLRRSVMLALLAFTAALRAGPEYPDKGPDVYDPTANGNELVATAIKRGAAEHKNILLFFGANWCIWCHRLHDMFEKNASIAQTLKTNYVLVPIDVNTRKGEKRNADVDERYGHPMQHGLPVLVVLDHTGKQLTTQDSGELEDGKDGHDPAKVLAFLERWKPAK